MDAIERACRFIEARVAEGERFTLAELGAHCGVSPWHLQRQFRRAMGVSPHDYGDQHRLARFRDELQQGEGVAAATYGAGYGSSSRVYERADGLIGMTPATYAKGGKGAEIAYGTAASPLGRLLAAATPRGICFVGLGDSDAMLERELRQDFHAAESIRRDDGELGRALDALLAYLAGKEPHVALPAGYPGDGFPAPGLAGTAADSPRRNKELRRDCPILGQCRRIPRRGPRLRHQPDFPHRALPPGPGPKRRSHRISVGNQA